MCHGDIRAEVCMVDTPSEYNFPESARLVLIDGLNQFESFADKQQHHIEQDHDLYLPPDIFEDLARKGKHTWPEMLKNKNAVKGWKCREYDQFK